MWTTDGFWWKMIYSHGGVSASFRMFTGGYFPAMARHGHGQPQKKSHGMGYPMFRQTRDGLWQFLLDCYQCLSMSGFHVWFQVRTEADWCIPGPRIPRVPQKCLGMPWKETLPQKSLDQRCYDWWTGSDLINLYGKLWSTAMNMIHPAMTISSPASASGICWSWHPHGKLLFLRTSFWNTWVIKCPHWTSPNH